MGIKRFSIRLGKLDTQDVFEGLASIIMVGIGIAGIADISRNLGYDTGSQDTLSYLANHELYDTSSYKEVKRRGKVYSAKKFLEANSDVD